MRTPAFGAAALAILLALGLFQGLIGFALVSPEAAFWRSPPGDMATYMGGYEALLHAPWGFPPTVVDSLSDKPLSIVYADSLPWLSLFLKATGLSAWLNPFGLWLAVSYVMQVLGMIWLLRALSVQRAAVLIAGAALALLFPPWLARQMGHTALSGHWILLVALALAVSSARSGLRRGRIAAFAGLAALTTGTHAYHLVPVAACFGAALLSEMLQGGRLVRCVLAAGAVAGAVGLSAWVLGYGYGVGQPGAAGDLGLYAMNVLGPLWPTGSRLAGQRWTGGWFEPVLDPTGYQTFEGFQYLGAGALGLIVAAGAAWAWTDRRALGDGQAWRRWGPLAAAMAVLTLWAIGWNVWLGPRLVLEVPKPAEPVAGWLAIFRCHGRFFWAVGYLLLALAITWAGRRRAITAAALLGAALVLQTIDVGPLFEGVRAIHRAKPSLLTTGLADATALRGRPWRIAPVYWCSKTAVEREFVNELDLAILRGGGRTNTFGTARNNDPACEVVDPSLGAEASPDDPTVTVVVADEARPGPLEMRIAERGDCYRTPRAIVCGRGLAGVPGLAPIAAGSLADRTGRVVLSVNGARLRPDPAFAEGWWPHETGGVAVWSVARTARLRLGVQPAAVRGLRTVLEVRAIGFSDMPLRPQRVGVAVNGRPVGRWQVAPVAFATYHVALPDGLATLRTPMTVDFTLPDARTSADPRLLGIAVESVTVRARETESK